MHCDSKFLFYLTPFFYLARNYRQTNQQQISKKFLFSDFLATKKIRLAVN